MEGKLSEEEFKKKQIADITPIKQPINQSDFEVPKEPELEEGQENLEGGENKEEQTQSETKVPEYKAEAPAEPQPGGPAFQFKKPPMPKPMVKEPAGAKSLVQGGATATKELAKKAAKATVKAAIQIGTKVAAATAQYWLPILLAIVLIVGIIFAIIFFVRAISGAEGTTPVQAADILNDRPWISKVLGLAGDKDAGSKLTTEVLSGLLVDLTNLENEMADGSYSAETKAKVTAKIAEIRQNIATFNNLQPTDKTRASVAQKIVSGVGELVTLFSPALWHYSGETAWPIEEGKIIGYNGTLHCGTPMRTENCGRHRTFVQFMEGTADAVDIMAKWRTPVHAAFAGKVVKTGYVLGRYIQIKDDKGYLAVYAHMTDTKFKEGDTVPLGAEIGVLTYIGDGISHPHLHFEIYNPEGQAIVTTPEDMSNFNTKERRFTQKGEYVWDHMKSALNLK